MIPFLFLTICKLKHDCLTNMICISLDLEEGSQSNMMGQDSGGHPDNLGLLEAPGISTIKLFLRRFSLCSFLCTDSKLISPSVPLQLFASDSLHYIT